MNLKWKVCGMRDPVNIAGVAQINPDFMGFIFYHKSPRFVFERSVNEIKNLNGIQKVGVFVNETVENIMSSIRDYALDFVQLHGNESLEIVKELSLAEIKIIKVIRISDKIPMDELEQFAPFVSFFMFETYTPEYGGSGQKFDWKLLTKYSLTKSFFLSGGIDLDDIEMIKSMNLKALYAIDVNSRFETEPGIKNIERLRKLKNILA